ncbi:Poly(3-hydroxyalkanoate) polymerase family protein [Mesorhizobium plurifarium]|uniref:Poly(3-hydroxyalkanoate) polymerase family protein n=1 Tax=Mesorhizobium plurifarium TaxID=69974 RepID=A0A090GAX1_MESPL|nr:Poly(3-hydroxyalkanoate) polymerase family protein [Mesorhizobium plurifarium]
MAVASSCLPPCPDEEAWNIYRDVDRLSHALLAAFTAGISPISLLQAWQDWLLHLSSSPGKQAEVSAKAFEKFARLSGFLFRCGLGMGTATPTITPLPQDRRFQHQAWQAFPFNFLQQAFLLSQQWWHNATSGLPGVTRRHECLVEFYSRQILDTVSPSNFPVLNPEVIDQTLRKNGANFVSGANNLVDDLFRLIDGRPPAGAENFRPGIEVAVTAGEVIVRNELIELIRYAPMTETVKQEPILIVPAWIMKYYILDLSPRNSLVRYLVQNGYTVFCISWRNPVGDQAGLSLDDYRRLGVQAAMDAVEGETGSGRIHGVGYCLGGTLLSIAASAMARDGDHRFASLSLFAAQVDFEEPGELGLFIDESQIALLEDVMWVEGTLDQRRMAGAFQMLRSQDLIWSRAVREYLLGERAPMTDLMAWNADSTRMPYRMQSQYLRQLYLNNDLVEGRLCVEGRSVHLEDIRAPVFAVGTETDHVAPWRSVFKLTYLLDTDIDFVLTTGGHNAGIVSEPGHLGRSYRRFNCHHGDLRPNADEWVKNATVTYGSWWPAWVEWLTIHSGVEVAADRVTASASMPKVCAAPGTYVLER